MFTGLVATTGALATRSARGSGARLVVRADLGRDESLWTAGESIAVDGVCLTVDALVESGFAADASAETLARTTLGRIPIGRAVNLERSLRAGALLGGHLVTGHVDAVGALVERRAAGDADSLSFSMPGALSRLVAEKGSIAVNGVSLTVNAVSADRFQVAVIPHTRSRTNLGSLAAGDPVNLEVDLVARYVARYLEAQ